MKFEDIKSKTKDAVDYLVQSLESGQSDVLTQYLAAMGRFHTYSFGNVSQTVASWSIGVHNANPRSPLDNQVKRSSLS